MATFEEHCTDCARALGDRFEHVNEWLDELQPEYGPMHRPFRHQTSGVEYVRSMWGDRAAEAAEIHIARDCGSVLTPEEWRDHWGINTDHIDSQDLND